MIRTTLSFTVLAAFATLSVACASASDDDADSSQGAATASTVVEITCDRDGSKHAMPDASEASKQKACPADYVAFDKCSAGDITKWRKITDVFAAGSLITLDQDVSLGDHHDLDYKKDDQFYSASVGVKGPGFDVADCFFVRTIAASRHATAPTLPKASKLVSTGVGVNCDTVGGRISQYIVYDLPDDLHLFCNASGASVRAGVVGSIAAAPKP